MKQLLLILCLCLLPFGADAKKPRKNRAQDKPIAEHVFLLGLDGWAANLYSQMDMPVVKALEKEGCFTLKKRSVLPSSSAPNWASMFMGTGTEIHGYTQWGSRTPEIPSQTLNENGIFPTIFYLLNSQQPQQKVAAFYEWGRIQCLIDHKAMDYHKRTEDDNGDLSRKAAEYIKAEKPNLLAVIWNGPDHAGHASGWGSPEYMSKVAQVDGWVNEVIQATKDAGIYENSIFIITGDHGGKGKKHGGISDGEMHTPFIIVGKNIKQGKNIETPMMQYDVAATIAHIFRLQCPHTWIGRPVMEVFR